MQRVVKAVDEQGQQGSNKHLQFAVLGMFKRPSYGPSPFQSACCCAVRRQLQSSEVSVLKIVLNRNAYMHMGKRTEQEFTAKIEKYQH